MPHTSEKRRITVNGTALVDDRSAEGQRLLAAAHQNRVRPVCHCTSAGVPMYVARAGSKFILKRMPDSGVAHASSCESYVPPEALSGLGQVLGEAIAESEDRTLLRLGFSLSRQDKAGGGGEAGAEADTVAADPSKLTLRSVLHYLWQEAGLTAWSPRMQDKRSWRVVSWHTRKAAFGKFAKGKALSDRLFVPEPFDAAQKGEIARRRLNAWGAVSATKSHSRQLMICVGELKSIEPARFGHKLVLKHMPDAPLRINDDLLRKFNKRFATELELWQEDDDGHLMVICTFSVGRGGTAAVEEVSVMMTDHRWLPYEGPVDKLLIDTIADEGRRFTKSLRYNLPAEKPMASLVLTDTSPPTAMYLVADDDTDAADELHTLADETGTATWTWKVTDPMPERPVAPGRTAAQHHQTTAPRTENEALV